MLWNRLETYLSQVSTLGVPGSPQVGDLQSGNYFSCLLVAVVFHAQVYYVRL